MWVVPAARRLGAGRALVESAIAVAKAAAVTEIRLRVTESNYAALELYRKTGFIETGQREPLRPGSSLESRGMVIHVGKRPLDT